MLSTMLLTYSVSVQADSISASMLGDVTHLVCCHQSGYGENLSARAYAVVEPYPYSGQGFDSAMLQANCWWAHGTAHASLSNREIFFLLYLRVETRR